jgi:hypothetical protein
MEKPYWQVIFRKIGGILWPAGQTINLPRTLFHKVNLAS